MEDKNSFLSENAEAASVLEGRSLARVWWGIAIGVALAGVFLAISISQNGVTLPGIIIALFLLTFGASVTLEESSAREVMLWMCTKSISFPGIIWEFSIDGFIWLIAIKILFWLIGVVFGIIVAIVGFILGVLVAPFTYPFNLISYLREGD